jgi:hypothetical protein
MTSPHSGQQLGWIYWKQYIFLTAISLLMGIPLLVFMAILVSPLTVFLWNSLMPTLFGFKQISWLQGVGLFLLLRLLLSSK